MSSDKKPYVIAEIGSNHNGDFNLALKLIDMAALAGANAVKLQKRNNKTLFTEEMYNRPYEGYGPTYGKHREALEFDFPQFVEMKAYAEEKGLDFFATPFDVDSVEFLEKLGVIQYKVASASVTNQVLIKAIAETGKPVIMSGGGQSFSAIGRAVGYLDVNKLALLHCVAAYPCPPEMMNLLRIPALHGLFHCRVGLSDHQDGIALGAAAYALGARVFEKHITLDHSAKGTDHPFSLEFYGLSQYIKYLNQTAVALRWHEQPMKAEIAPVQKMGQSLYWSRTIPAGRRIQEEDIAIQSPQVSGALYPTPMNLAAMRNRVLTKMVNKGEPVTWGAITGNAG